MGAPLPAQHGVRKLFGNMPKATQSPRLGQAMRPQPGGGAGDKTFTTLPAGSSRLPGTGRQTPAIRRTTAAGLPGGQHGTQRMQQLAGAYGRPEGLSAGPRFVLAQAPAEDEPEGLVPDVSERSRKRRTKRAWRGDEADEGPGSRPDAREVRRKTSTGEAT